ncbi:unnamed protein product [Rotaria sp. Silwood1]|nr:unnamed protein product [Rotaria sp. Silwood1]
MVNVVLMVHPKVVNTTAGLIVKVVIVFIVLGDNYKFQLSESKGVILVETVGGNGSMGGSAGHGQDGSHGCNTYGGSGEDGRPRKDDNSGANGRNDGSEKNASVGRHVQVLRVYRHLY